MEDENKTPNDNPPQKTWKSLELFVSITKLEVFQHPASALLVTSIPFVAGSYFGYKQSAKRLQEWSTETTVDSGESISKRMGDPIKNADKIQLGIHTAGRALRIATLATVGTFGLVASGMFVGGPFSMFTCAWKPFLNPQIDSFFSLSFFSYFPFELLFGGGCKKLGFMPVVTKRWMRQ